MSIEEWYFGFHAPTPLNQLHIAPWGALGHVEAWGYTSDDTWVFIDPERKSTKVYAVHRHDDVEELLADKFTRCEEIFRTSHVAERTFPMIGVFSCVPVCAGMVGIRAFTPATFKRKLLQNGAERIHGPKGKPRGCKSARA